MPDMKNHLNNIDEGKLERLNIINRKFSAGEITLEEARAEMKEKVGSITPQEIACAEQMLNDLDENACVSERIKNVLYLYEGVLTPKEDDKLPEGHPILTYRRENSEVKKIFDRVDELVDKKFIKNSWLEIFEKLYQFRIHLSRKQNQLYSDLERKGFDRPSKIMWTLDDYIRDEITEVYTLLKDDKIDEFFKKIPQLKDDVLDLIGKEEEILFPTSLKLIPLEEFKNMRKGDDEIGYCIIDKPQGFLPEVQGGKSVEQDFSKDVLALLEKYNMASSSSNNILDVAEGKLTLDQINLIYKHLPVDVSYVDENEIVRFYSDTKERVFPRSKGVIGRDVKNCHPQKSVHVVEEIIDKFRKGEQDRSEFWINKPDVFIYIVYVAVRDTDGTFRGVLEMMQDCTHIRSLTDSRTLLTWETEDNYKKEDAAKGSYAQEGPQEEVQEEEGVLEINADTNMGKLLKAYPFIKDYLIEINPKYSKLNSPMARIIIQHANLKMVSERGEMDLDVLLEKIKERIAKENG